VLLPLLLIVVVVKTRPLLLATRVLLLLLLLLVLLLLLLLLLLLRRRRVPPIPKLRRKGGKIHRRVLTDLRGEDRPGSRMARVMEREVESVVVETRGVWFVMILGMGRK